jgi:hypothetical protein
LIVEAHRVDIAGEKISIFSLILHGGRGKAFLYSS